MDSRPSNKTKGGTNYHDTSSSVGDWEHDDDTEKPSLCCLQGCISATVVGVSFFIGLPSGILLVVQAVNNGNDTTLLSVGIVLIILPIIILIIVLLLCFNQKRLPNLLCCCKKAKSKSVVKTASKPTQSDPPKPCNGHVVSNGVHHHSNQNGHIINTHDNHCVDKTGVINNTNSINNNNVTYHSSRVNDNPVYVVQSQQMSVQFPSHNSFSVVS